MSEYRLSEYWLCEFGSRASLIKKLASLFFPGLWFLSEFGQEACEFGLQATLVYKRVCSCEFAISCEFLLLRVWFYNLRVSFLATLVQNL